MKTTYQVNNQGYYGEYGGAYIPEILFNNVEELRTNYLSIIESQDFINEFDSLLKIMWAALLHFILQKIYLVNLKVIFI